MTRFEFDCIADVIQNHDFNGFKTFAVGIEDDTNNLLVCAGNSIVDYKYVSIPFCEFRRYRTAEDMFDDIERRYNNDNP